MATSRIIFYKSNLVKGNNVVVENIRRFLNSSNVYTIATYDNVQYIRPEYEISFKLNKNQSDIIEEDVPDYMTLEETGIRWYYYVDSIEQVSENTLRYKCTLDVLNTFNGSYHLTNRSMIERGHSDRFTKLSSTDTDTRTIVQTKVNHSKTKEDITPKLYRTEKSQVYDGNGVDRYHWVIIYATGDPDSEEGAVPQIEIYCKDPIYVKDGEGYIHTSGIDNINRTSSRLVKIIECPYCPIELIYSNNSVSLPPNSGFTITPAGGFKTTDLNTEFVRNIIASYNISKYTISRIDLNKSTLSDINSRPVVDPKVYNSNAYKDAFVYDSFEWDLPIEELDTSNSGYTATQMTIGYKQSNAISSSLGFKFDLTNPNVVVKPQETFDNVLLSNRNNELPIYNSEYLNYLRNGFNYDKEKLKHNIETKGVENIMKTVGSLAAIGLGAYTSNSALIGAGVAMGTSSIVSSYDLGQSNKAGEMDIQQKINDAASRAYSIANVNDLNLFDWYSGNRLYHMIFEPAPEILELIKRYYELYGYARGYYEVPNVSSRYHYNYVRGTVDIEGEDYQPFDKYKEIIKGKYAEGVYFVHNRAATPNLWDIHQRYNNVECSLLPAAWTAKAV